MTQRRHVVLNAVRHFNIRLAHSQPLRSNKRRCRINSSCVIGAMAVALLASDESRIVTGTALLVDGDAANLMWLTRCV